MHPGGVHIWALCPDLLFASRIRGASAGVGVGVAIVRAARELLEAVASSVASVAHAGTGAAWAEAAATGARNLALVDLAAARDGVEAIAALKARFPSVTVIAFAPHVAAERIQAARDAGADRVLARSAFVAQLPQILRPE